MTRINPSFPSFSKDELKSSPSKISEALLQKGLCYISGYEDALNLALANYKSLKLSPNGNVKILSPAAARMEQPGIYSVLFAPEFKIIKRQVLGLLYKDEIEIFCQHTGPSEVPPSGALHFDIRYTFKSWYYMSDVSLREGPMRVVPLDRCGDYSPIAIRNKFGSRSLFQGARSQHKASEEALKVLEPAAEFVTGPQGTLFLHISEAWHGASPVKKGAERNIIRGHSRPFFDRFLK